MAIDVPTLCLGLLSRGEATGYALKKAFEEGSIGEFMEASFGSIYPALTKLTREGLADCRKESGERGPDKKIYSITPAGLDTLSERLNAGPPEDRVRLEFLFLLKFADLLSPVHRNLVIDGKIAAQRAKLARLRSEACDPARPGDAFVKGYGEAMLETSLRYLEANRHLLDQAHRGAAPDIPSIDETQIRPTQARPNSAAGSGLARGAK